jgi:hypothetical protein
MNDIWDDWSDILNRIEEECGLDAALRVDYYNFEEEENLDTISKVYYTNEKDAF